MVLNYIWVGFFLVGFVVAIIQAVVFQDIDVFQRIITSTFDMSKFAVMDIALPLAGVMTLWLGFMSIGEKAGAINFLSRIPSGRFFRREKRLLFVRYRCRIFRNANRALCSRTRFRKGRAPTRLRAGRYPLSSRE